MSEPAGPTTDAVTEFLRRPESYPDGAKQVELRETHISRVFLTERFVYKLKKPVRFEFLDFSTLAARRQACDDEVRLNRRMAGNVYLGVVPITRNAGGILQIDGDGEAIEWLVKMRRLDERRMLDRLIREAALTEDDIEHLSAWLAAYYAAAPKHAVTAGDYGAAVLAHVRANRTDLLSAAPGEFRRRIERIHNAQLTLLRRRPALLADRAAAGRVIDGHGDLRPEHICLETPPVVYDCVEFSAEFRRLDVADELSFLLMECETLGHAEVGRRILAAYQKVSGDRPSETLLRFYESYRACVRGKVAALRYQQQTGAARAASLVELGRYLGTAERAIVEFHTPTLYVMRGLMGSGKSTLAAALADELGALWLRTDEIRRELFAASAEPETFGGGIYRPEHRAQVYEELLRRSAAALREGLSVVADGAFLHSDDLRKAASRAAAQGAEFIIVECRCPPEIAKRRIAARLEKGCDPSEARPELYDRQATAVEPIPGDLAGIGVDTTRPLAAQCAAVYAAGRSLPPTT